jgi:hypothetical protein
MLPTNFGWKRSDRNVGGKRGALVFKEAKGETSVSILAIIW